MVQVKYGLIPDKLFVNYLNFLIGKVFKLLPMREQNDETLNQLPTTYANAKKWGFEKT